MVCINITHQTARRHISNTIIKIIIARMWNLKKGSFVCRDENH
jgi:hypothetical protein